MESVPLHLKNKYPNGMEAIDVIEIFELNKRGHVQNAAKYILRAGKKDPNRLIEDLSKAVFYLTREIKCLQSGRDAE